MKRTNIILVFLSILIGVLVATSCSKDHDIPTGKVFNADSGGGSAVNTYTITVNASPANGGTVQINNGTAGSTASGTFAHGTTIQLKATANSGYDFSQWNDGGAQTHNVTVTAGETYTAYFTAQPQAPTGAINGKFTINANGDKVHFSQGNLQYRASTNIWQFAANQYDYIGSDNSNISQTYSGWIDLFGWGTSGYHDTSDLYNVNYQPWSTSTSTVNETYNKYGYGPSTNMPSPNLTGSSANYDWGVCNPISNGGGQAGQWRTLTREEWVWVLGPSSSSGVNCRTSSTVNGTPNARYAKGQVAGVHGVIVFPDSYTHPSGVAQPVGINETGNTGWNGNDYSSTDFGLMQANGAVFLPAAGYRGGTTVYYVGGYGDYWSASYLSSDYARRVSFSGAGLYTDGSGNRGYGHSVRLACPAEN